MDTTVDALIVDLLLWLAARERTYSEALDARRTSCPRLPVWEEANARGLVCRVQAHGREFVRVAPAGIALLEKRGVQAHLEPLATSAPIP